MPTPLTKEQADTNASIVAGGFQPDAVTGKQAPAPTLTTRYANNLGATGTRPGVDAGFKIDPTGNKVWYDDAGTATGRVDAPSNPAPDENGIKETYRANAQSMVDAIKNQFDKYITDDTSAKKTLESKTYINNLASGLSGSPTGAASETKAANTGQAKIEQDKQKETDAINQVLSNSDSRASQEFQTERESYLKTQQDRATAESQLTGNIKAEATKEIQTFGKSMSYDDFVKTYGQDKANQYMKELGTDEVGLKAAFLGAKGDQKPAFSQKVGNNWVIGHTDPTTGKTSVETFALPTDGGDWKFQTIDSKPYFVNTATQQIKPATSQDGSALPTGGKPVAGAPSGFTQEDIGKGHDVITRGGKDGYANPSMYVNAYTAWINQGGNIKTFLEMYPPEQYMDPNDKDLYPTFLQPKTAKASTSSDTSGARTI